MSSYGYLIYQLLRAISATEAKHENTIPFLDGLAATVKSGDWAGLELAWSLPCEGWKRRIIPLDKMDPKEREQLVYLPWFYDCNRQRYSMWEGKTDSRTARDDQQLPTDSRTSHSDTSSLIFKYNE